MMKTPQRLDALWLERPQAHIDKGVKMPIAAEGKSLASGRPSGREILWAVALAALGFVATAGLLHAAIRDPLHLHADIRSEKLAMMESWRGQVFSAAFGTSHVH